MRKRQCAVNPTKQYHKPRCVQTGCKQKPKARSQKQIHTMTLNKKLASMIAILWIGLVLIGAFGAWQSRSSMIADRRDQLTTLVEQAHSIVNRYYTLSQEHVLSEADAKKQALDTISAIRYGTDGYLSVNDSQPVMLMHPFKPALVGKNLSGFTDPAGNHLFVDIVNAASQGKGGFVDYLWSKPGSDTPVPKTSYAMRFAPWDWVLVTGMYMDDVQKAFYVHLLSWLSITFALGGIATIVMVLVLRSVKRTLGGEAFVDTVSRLRTARATLG